MNRVTRHSRICELIARQGACSIEELAGALKVSGMTIRRDLRLLSEQGKAIRTRGGAIGTDRVSFEFEFLKRTMCNRSAKEAIAKAAAAQIEDDQSVMLDSGTTTLILARQLRGRRLVVITTSLPIASQLQYDRNIEVLLLGGYVRASAPDLAGALTEANLETLYADVAFIGAQGVDRRGGTYQKSPEVARMLTKMAASANRVFVVADHSKLDKTALCRYGQLQDWTGLITDDGADRSALAALKKAGIRLIEATAKTNQDRRVLTGK